MAGFQVTISGRFWVIAKAILNQAGFEAHAFEAPRKAIAACDEMVPDLLISDVIMPEMTGIEVAIRFRKAQPQCKILLFSGQASTSDLLEKARAEGYDFELLTKPVPGRSSGKPSRLTITWRKQLS